MTKWKTLTNTSGNKNKRNIWNRVKKWKEGRLHKIFCTTLIFTRSFYITNGTGEQYIITSSCTHCVESSACFIQKYPTGYVTLGLFTYSHNTNMHVLNVIRYKSTLLFIYLLCAGLLGWQSEIEGLILHSTQVNTQRNVVWNLFQIWIQIVQSLAA